MSSLSTIIKKLGHPLEEIRVRALNNLVSKLECGVLTVSELIDQDNLFHNLLNWFEFENVPDKEKVLYLILKLVQAENGSTLLLKSDPALAGLRKLKEHDGIVQNILKIVSNKHNSASYQSSPIENNVKIKKPNLEIVYKEVQEREVNLPAILSSRDDLSICFNIWSLPWVHLVHSDTHVLTAVEESLQDDEQALHSCQFFINVVSQDFPSEVFLQRPRIIKAIIDLLAKPSPLNTAAASCLGFYTKMLHERINSICDTSMACIKVENLEAKKVPDDSLTNLLSESEDLSSYKSDSSWLELSVPQFCVIAINKVLELCGSSQGVTNQLVPRLLSLFTRCITDKKLIWTSTHPKIREINHHMHTTLVSLATVIPNSFVKSSIEQLHTLTVATEILTTFVPIDISASSVPSQLQTQLTLCLFDPVLALIYPEVHDILLIYVTAFKANGERLYLDTKCIMDSMTSSIEFSKSASCLSTNDALDILESSLSSLAFHKKFDIIYSFVNLCVTRWNLSGDEQIKASSIARSLLAHVDRDISNEMYMECQKKVMTLLGPEQASKTSNPIQSLAFLLDCSLLAEIICHGMSSENDRIKVAADDIILYILKCNPLVTKLSWENVLELIIPVLPLLQSFASKDTPMGRSILGMTDPDIAKSTGLPKLQVIKGNIRLLFHKNALCREEGCARSLWMLKIQTPISKRLCDICVIEKAITNKSPSNGLYEVGSVVRVLELLTVPCVEDRVRQSALVQLSVMTEDQRLQEVFIELKGVTTILCILESSEAEWTESAKDYVTPIVTILKNLARYNSKVRFLLSQDVNLCLWVLKGLFLLTEWRLQRDAAQLLALLMFSDFAITTVENLSFPQLIVDNYHIPFVCGTHWTVSPHSKPTNKGELIGKKPCQRLLGIHWVLVREGDIDKVHAWDKLPGDIPADLCISLQALRHVQDSDVVNNCRKLLYDIQNATTHKKATKAINKLTCYVELERLVNYNKIIDLPWRDTFYRFLLTTPSCTEDYHLLIIVLEFLILLAGCIKHEMKWVAVGLQTSPQLLLKSLFDCSVNVGDDHLELREEVNMKILNLCELCMKNNIKGWQYFVQLIVQNLDYCHKQNFYSLGLVLNKLSCLQVQLQNYSINCSVLWELISAFHCDVPDSCMGLCITKTCLLSLNMLLASAIHSQTWEVHWVKDDNLKWMPYLLSSRDIIVRACTLQLLAGMCTSRTAAAAVLRSFETIWDQALRFTVDHTEASIVREHAAILCANIASFTKGQVCVTSAMEVGLCREFAVAVTQLSLEDKIDLNSVYPSTNCSSKTESEDIEFNLLPTAPSFITSGCSLVNNLLILNKEIILSSVQEDGLEGALFRCLQECTSVTSAMCVKMYTIVCSLLCDCVVSNPSAAVQIVPALNRLLNLGYFELEKYCEEIKQLWSEAFKLLSTIIFHTKPNLTLPADTVSTLCESIIQSADNSLQLNALAAVPGLTGALDEESASILCVTLLEQWQVLSGLKRSTLVKALTSIMSLGKPTTDIAMQNGLLQKIVQQLTQIQVGLTIKIGSIQQLKKNNPLLQDLSLHLGLTCNFIAGNSDAKVAAAELGLADVIHKLWAWCLIDNQLMLKVLHTLITFTADCPQSAQTLVLTSTMSGIGQRKTPSSRSFIHTLIGMLTKEQHPLEIQKCLLILLTQSCQAQECRVIIAKSNLFPFIVEILQDKKQIKSEKNEIMWFQFLYTFTYFNEGQMVIPRIGLLEPLMECAESGHAKSRDMCVGILRNVSFNHSNRSHLLTCEHFLTLLGEILLSGTKEQKYNVSLILFTLASNCHKAKILLRSRGFCSRLQLAEATQSNDTFRSVRNLLQPLEDS